MMECLGDGLYGATALPVKTHKNLGKVQVVIIRLRNSVASS